LTGGTVSFQPQTLVMHYFLGDRLSAGKTSTVFLAFDLVGLEFVVIKVLNREFVEDTRVRARKERETEIFRKLDHPCIVGFRNAFEHACQPCLVLEHVRGRRLIQMVDKQNPLTVGLALRILEDGAAALGHVHGCGVLHRDVTPSNLIVTVDGRARLIDFGRALSDHKALQTVPGELALSEVYVAPEVIKSAEHSPASDVYALAASLYHALAGTPYFSATDYDMLLTQKFKPAPSIQQWRPDVPEWFAGLLGKMLAVSPAERHGTTKDVLLELGRHQAMDGVPAAGDPLDVVLERIRSLMSREKHEDALRIAESLETQHPRNAEVRLALSRVNEALGRQQAAMRHLESAAMFEPSKASYAIEYALLLVRQQQEKRALAFLRKVPPGVAASELVDVLQKAVEARLAHPEIVERTSNEAEKPSEGFVAWLKGLWSS